MNVLIPHFDLPFRFVGSHPAVVNQDTLKDVVNCVEAVVSTFTGDRIEIPDFGIEDPTFSNQPIQLQPLLDAILTQEPRASIVMDQAPGRFDALIARVTARVTIKEGA